MKQNIDEFDKSILRLLQQDGNMAQKQIAYRLNKSFATICERIKWLTKSGYITGKHAVINRKLLNLEVLGYINLNLDDSSDKEVKRFTQAVENIKGVCECVKIIGKFNTQVKVITADITTLSRIHDRIANLDNVSDAEIYIAAESVLTDKGIDF